MNVKHAETGLQRHMRAKWGSRRNFRVADHRTLHRNFATGVVSLISLWNSLGLLLRAGDCRKQKNADEPDNHNPPLKQFFFLQAEDGIRDKLVTGVQTCALPI